MGRIRTDVCFHFGFQSSVTQEHLPSPTARVISPKWLFWVLLGDAGCKMWRTENPRVGGSIPPLATINSSVGSQDFVDRLAVKRLDLKPLEHIGQPPRFFLQVLLRVGPHNPPPRLNSSMPNGRILPGCGAISHIRSRAP
jgi:hypothetical protein